MKKIVLPFIVFALITTTVRSQDKAFHKGTVSVDLGIGGAVYGTKIHDEYDTEVWNGVVNTTVRKKKDTFNAAASAIIPMSVEYGFTNWFGIGARFAFSKYISGADSTNNHVRPTIRSLDADLLLNFHLIKSKHFDMPISLIVGYSNFSYKANNLNTSTDPTYNNGNVIVRDNGLNYGIALVPRIFFGDHIGMFFNVGFMGYNYPSMTFSNNSDSNLNNDNNKNELFKLKGVGGNIGIGLIVKI